MTDDEAFEEAVPQPRCPACLAAVGPDQQYCLQCGERLAPAGPLATSPQRGRTWPPAAAIVAGGAVLLLAGGFGIAYGFTRDDSPKAAGTTVGTGSTTGAVVPPTLSVPGTNRSVPTFTDLIPTGSTLVPTNTERIPTGSTGSTGNGTGATTPPPTTTHPLPTPNEANDWPSGRDDFAVLLVSDDTEKFDFASITAKKQQATSNGFSNAGVLNSDDYFTLNPGYWVLYIGPYATKSEAQAAQAKARVGGYSDAYVRRVAE